MVGDGGVEFTEDLQQKDGKGRGGETMSGRKRAKGELEEGTRSEKLTLWQ